jgi:pilus assembly protein CpaB
MDRQRIILLFGAAALLAGLLSWFLYANTIAPHAEARTPVMAAVHDLQVGQMVRKGDLKKVSVLPRDIPKGAVVSEKEALGRVALYPINANEPVVNNGLSQLAGADGIPATIPPGYRAVSITITDVSGVAGLAQPGAHVDVLFTRPGTMAEAITSTILQNVRVLAVGHTVQLGQAVDLKAPKVPVATLVVTPEDAQKLELAKNQGRISLSLRNPLDGTEGVDGKPVNADVLDPSLKRKVEIIKLRNSSDDPKLLGILTAEKPKPEPVKIVPVKPAPVVPPPPRAVIDVFRGDKHVQEVFRD